uniref:Uncharacterized protein n=1 Tax=Mycena chlorophos TaxID=658473 RepID=A0ABQ0LIL9_MYCCL|nr:predicted protein [Mycena chlorophos]
MDCVEPRIRDAKHYRDPRGLRVFLHNHEVPVAPCRCVAKGERRIPPLWCLFQFADSAGQSWRYWQAPHLAHNLNDPVILITSRARRSSPSARDDNRRCIGPASMRVLESLCTRARNLDSRDCMRL